MQQGIIYERRDRWCLHHSPEKQTSRVPLFSRGPQCCRFANAQSLSHYQTCRLSHSVLVMFRHCPEKQFLQIRRWSKWFVIQFFSGCFLFLPNQLRNRENIYSSTWGWKSQIYAKVLGEKKITIQILLLYQLPPPLFFNLAFSLPTEPLSQEERLLYTNNYVRIAWWWQ